MIKSFETRAFTLMELMIASLILALVLVGLLGSYIASMQLTEISRNTSLAMNDAQAATEIIEEYIVNCPLINPACTNANIKALYDNQAFPLLGFVSGTTGSGVSYIDDTNPDLLRITVTVCWRQSRGRVIGEDANLNGQFDAGEDTITVNNALDSPAQIITYVARR